MNEWYLLAAASAVALAVVTPPLWRWCAGVDKPARQPWTEFDNARRLQYWRNRVEFFKAALAKELRLKRGKIGWARVNLANCVAEVLRLEAQDPAIRLAMLTGSVTSDPADAA
jgi:hypothetical protein